METERPPPARSFTQRFPLKEIGPRLRGDGPKLLATMAILQRLAHAKPEAQAFLHHLSLQVVAGAQDGRLSRAMALAILYGKPNKKKLRLRRSPASQKVGRLSSAVSPDVRTRPWTAKCRVPTSRFLDQHISCL